MVERIPAANSCEAERGLVADRCVARSERSEARASRRIESEPRLDVGRDHVDLTGERSTPACAGGGGGCASPRGIGGGDRRALRRRTLARQFRGLSHDATRYPGKRTG